MWKNQSRLVTIRSNMPLKQPIRMTTESSSYPGHTNIPNVVTPERPDMAVTQTKIRLALQKW